MALGLSGAAMAEETDAFLAQLEGSYVALFPVICAPEYDDIWLASCTEYAGEEDAAMYVEMLKGACVGDIYGEEAIATYADDPESAVFKCDFIGNVAEFTFAGNEISGTDADGNIVFSHEYTHIGEDAATGFAIYQSADMANDGFDYFLLAPDTPVETFHTEFRYGDNLDDIGAFTEGEYAYWLAAGFESDYTDEVVEKVVDLFCEENIEAA